MPDQLTAVSSIERGMLGLYRVSDANCDGAAVTLMRREPGLRARVTLLN